MPTHSLMYPQNLDIVIVMTVMKHLAIDAGFDNPDKFQLYIDGKEIK